MIGFLRILPISQKLLVDFFSGPEANDFNVDIFGIMIPLESDHLLSQFDNLHRLPHIKNKYFTAFSHYRSLLYQLTGFGYRHKIAGYIWISDCQRPALEHLLFKQWNDRTIGTQYITKAGHNKISPGVHIDS